MVGGVLAPPQEKLAQLNIINPKQEAALKEEASGLSIDSLPLRLGQAKVG